MKLSKEREVAFRLMGRTPWCATCKHWFVSHKDPGISKCLAHNLEVVPPNSACDEYEVRAWED